MKHTSEALQTMGMKVSEADNIMLDLEDSASDLNSLQTTLSSNFMDSDLSDTDLSEEMALILSDDSMEPVIHRQSQTTKQIVSPHSVRWQRLSRCALWGRLAKMTVTEGQRRVRLFYNTQ